MRKTVTGHGIDSGHFLPEEAPEETYRALHSFFAGKGRFRCFRTRQIKH